VRAIQDAVGVLHAGDVDELERRLDVRARRVAEADEVELARRVVDDLH